LRFRRVGACVGVHHSRRSDDSEFQSFPECTQRVRNGVDLGGMLKRRETVHFLRAHIHQTREISRPCALRQHLVKQ